MQKFDMGRAWDGALALLKGNRDVLLIVAGVFFFLPYLAVGLFVPELAGTGGMGGPGGEDPEQAMQAMLETISRYSWLLVLVVILQAVGVLGLLSLLTDDRRPTVGEALATGAKSLLPYIGSQILQGLAMVGVVAVPLALAAMTGSAAVGALLAIPAAAIIIYLMIKFSLVSPVIVIEGIMNPLNALRRSWNLTKGNSFRLALFYLLLFVALIVVSMVLGMVIGVVALIGGVIGSLLSAVLNSVLNVVGVLVSMAVIASIHRQLAGTSVGQLQETFD